MTLKILVTLPLNQLNRDYLVSRVNDSDIRFGAPSANDDLRWAEVIFGNVSPADRLLGCDSLTWLHSPNVGLESYATVNSTRPDLTITNSVGVVDRAVAEHGIALLLSLTRGIPLLVEAKQERTWQRQPFIDGRVGTTIAGKSAHVLGYGRIARALIMALVGLGMRVTVYRRQPFGDDPMVEQFLAFDALPDQVGSADVLVCLLPERPETRGIVSAAVLAAMKPTAYLINLGRGSAVDEPALIAALTEGRLAGAGLDVFAQEPLPADSPLWTLPNVVLSPHVAGRFDDEPRQHIERFLEHLSERDARLVIHAT